MNSLQELNSWGSTPVDFVDARSSKVIVNRQSPRTAVNQTFDAYASLSVTPQPGIEIVEIINYQTANVRYRVSVITGSSPLFTGSTVTFGTFNSGVTLSQSGDVYTVSGIHSVSDWDSAKNFTWTLPVAFASYPQWYLECTIIYYDSALATDVETTWDIIDDRFYNVAALSSESAITAIIGVKSPTSAALTSAVTVYANPWNQVVGESAMASAATFTCEGLVNVTFLNAVSTMTVNAIKTARITDNLASVASMSIAAVALLVNLDPRSYLANIGNGIFATNTPQVDTLNSADTFSIVISSSLGSFASNSVTAPTSTLTISGTKDQVNAAIVGAHFYPTKGSSASGTFNWAQSRNGTLEINKNIALTGVANAFAETTTIYSTDSTFTPTRSQVVYGFADVLLVGGGGNGAYGGGGGGGGVTYQTNQSLSYTDYPIVVGQGGINSVVPGAGTNSTALGFQGTFGRPGSSSATNTYQGGLSGNSVLGGVGRSGPIGGGGGGAGGVGGIPVFVESQYYGGNGGIGVSNSITGVATYYGGGGGGYFARQSYEGTTYQGIGGLGGGGAGLDISDEVGGTRWLSDGVNGLGGGGGGGSTTTEGYFQRGIGGRGVVIIKIHA